MWYHKYNLSGKLRKSDLALQQRDLSFIYRKCLA